MRFSEEQVQDILALKEKLTVDIEKHREEIEILERNVRVLDSILKQSSFTKASDLVTTATTQQRPKQQNANTIPITKGSGGEVIANAYVTPDQVSVVLDDKLDISSDTPPFKSFFMDRIIGEMKRKDSAEVENGRIQKEFAIDLILNKNGSNLREIIVRNYRQKERVNEIINTLGWSLTRMLENTNK